MPTAKCRPPSTALIPDEVPFEPPAVEPVDDDVAPVAVPVAEADALEVEKVAVGSAEMMVQVPPIKNGERALFNNLVSAYKESYLTTCRSVWIVRQERYCAGCSQLN
jgi:hypothetical protein